MSDLGKAIKMIRTYRNLSQTELALNANVSSSYISLLENNERDPTMDTLQRIAKALGVTMLVLIFMAERDEFGVSHPEIAEKLLAVAFSD